MDNALHITLIGSGNVAWHLGSTLAVNHTVDAVWSRRIEHARHLAALTGGTAIDSMAQLPTNSDFYILAVSDDAIATVAKSLPPLSGLVVHTSGSIAMSALEGAKRIGVFYPFQTFSKQKKVQMDEVPFLVEANNVQDIQLLSRLAQSVSPKVFNASSAQRLKLHLAAVFASNFTNHLYGIAGDILKNADLPFDLLHPLLAETAQKACSMNPYEAQTGPAVRGDAQVIAKHLKLLEQQPQWQQLYRQISRSIAEQQRIISQNKT